MYIENINGPADVKKLNIAQMTVLASEMRDALLTKLSRHGGCTMYSSPRRISLYSMFPTRPIRTRC